MCPSGLLMSRRGWSRDGRYLTHLLDDEGGRRSIERRPPSLSIGESRWLPSGLRSRRDFSKPLGLASRNIRQFLGISGRSIAAQVTRMVANRGRPVFRDHHVDDDTVTLIRPEEEKICCSIMIVCETIVPTVETKRLKLSIKCSTDANGITLVEFVRPRHHCVECLVSVGQIINVIIPSVAPVVVTRHQRVARTNDRRLHVALECLDRLERFGSRQICFLFRVQSFSSSKRYARGAHSC